MSMTLLCWNVAGRVERQPEQSERVVALEPACRPPGSTDWNLSISTRVGPKRDLPKVRSHEALHAHLASGHARGFCAAT
jgi:hypothetical protein